MAKNEVFCEMCEQGFFFLLCMLAVAVSCDRKNGEEVLLSIKARQGLSLW